jgi:hypothetical protein
MNQTSPYKFIGNEPCVRSKWLYEDAKIISKPNYDKLKNKGWFVSAVNGGNGREAWVKFETFRPKEKEKTVELAGNPYEVCAKNKLQELLLPDSAARDFFNKHRKPNGDALGDVKEKYINNAQIYNAIGALLDSKGSYFKSRKKMQMWQEISKAVNELEGIVHSVPGYYRNVQADYENYKKIGYSFLIHGNEGTENRKIIKGDIAEYLIALRKLPTKMNYHEIWLNYEKERKKRNWKPLTEQAIRKYLEEPEQKYVWYLGRHGEKDWRAKFGYTFKRDKSEWFPNAYWNIDGTKLDFYYMGEVKDNKTGKIVKKIVSKLRIDPVFDVFSEKIIGWAQSYSEDHIDHYLSLKMAMNTAGCRPYLFTYDNQGGHKSKRMQELYSSMVAKNGGLHHPHKANRSNGPAEQIFNRLQQQEVCKFWFSDKQGVGVKRLDNRPNIEFIMANTHRLPDEETAIKAWEICVKNWNESNHPKLNMSRNDAYNLEMPMREDTDYLDIINIFGINNTKPITYKASGLLMRLGNKQYEFEVCKSDGSVDYDFRAKNIGRKFIVRYDPELLNDCVEFYQKTEQGLTFVAVAKAKRSGNVIPINMKEGEKRQFEKDWRDMLAALENVKKRNKQIEERTKISAESIIDQQEQYIKMGGYLPKEEQIEAEAYEEYAESRL